MNENEYVITYNYLWKRRFEHVWDRSTQEEKDLFAGRHNEHIDSCILAKYSTHKL